MLEDPEKFQQELMTCAKVEGVTLQRDGKFYAGLNIYPRTGEVRRCVSEASFDTEAEAITFIEGKIAPMLALLGMVRKMLSGRAESAKQDPNYPKGMECTRFDKAADGKRKFCAMPATWYVQDKDEFACDACRDDYVKEYPQEAHRFTRIH
jgi:hypothetical protein